MADKESVLSPLSFPSLEELQALLLEAEEGGESIEMAPARWDRLRVDSERDSAVHRKAS